MVLRVGLIGLGAVTSPLALQWAAGGFPKEVEFVGALTRSPREDPPIPVVHDAAELIALGARYVVEGAGHDAVRSHVEGLLEAGVEVAVTSIGALIDDALRERLLAAAEAGGGRLILPSAGITRSICWAAWRKAGWRASRSRSGSRRKPGSGRQVKIWST
jgi:aspartate dehydrogenase